MVLNDGALYDIKTCNDFKWKSMFGKYSDKKPDDQYCLQLGTYGLYYRENGIRVDKMSLLFYAKNNSRMKEAPVDIGYIDRAERYWLELNERVKAGVPPVELGIAPVFEWECNEKYCSFYDVCGGGLKELKKLQKEFGNG